MDIKPISKKEVEIKNGEQKFQIQTVNFKDGKDVFHIFFDERYKLHTVTKGHICITSVRK